MNKLYLMNKNNIVATFDVTKGIFEKEYSLYEISGQLPLGFSNIDSWINNRKASKHNEHLKKIMKECGCDKTEGFIQMTHAASLNDSFWVKYENDEATWEKINFYNNEFNEVISKLAFGGLELYGIELSSTFPEMCTDGSFRKCWGRKNGEIYLYKAGQTGASNVGLEPYCEVMASELVNNIGQTTQYKLGHINREIASKCKLFTNADIGYVPMSRLGVNVNNVNDIYKFFQKINAEDQFCRLIVSDTISFNVDRHAGNYGVLVNNNTQEIITMAPNFDLNLSLLPYIVKDEFYIIGDKMLGYGPRIGKDFIEIAKHMLTPEIRASLINLKGFEFSFRGDEKFDEERVKFIEHIVERQIDGILDKNILYTKDVFMPSPKEDTLDHDLLKLKAENIEEKANNIISFFKNNKYISNIQIYEEYGTADIIDDIEIKINIKNNKDTYICISAKTSNIYFEQNGLTIDISKINDENIEKIYLSISEFLDNNDEMTP